MPGTHHLFTVTRGLLRLAILLCLLLITLLGLVMGALMLAAIGVFHLPIPAKEISGLAMSEVIGAAAMAVGAGVISIALIAWMFMLMARIIDSAAHGDPFVTVNADRLNHIGILLLAIQAIGLVVHIALNMMPDRIRDHVSFGFDASASAILAALLIFVLAQIFRRGSEMRAELEGTV